MHFVTPGSRQSRVPELSVLIREKSTYPTYLACQWANTNWQKGNTCPLLAQKDEGFRNEIKGNPAEWTAWGTTGSQCKVKYQPHSTHSSSSSSWFIIMGSWRSVILFLLSLLVHHLHTVNICKPLAGCCDNKSKVCYSPGNSLQGKHREVGGTGSRGAAEPPAHTGAASQTSSQSSGRWLSNPSSNSSGVKGNLPPPKYRVREQPQIQITPSPTTTAITQHQQLTPLKYLHI